MRRNGKVISSWTGSSSSDAAINFYDCSHANAVVGDLIASYGRAGIAQYINNILAMALTASGLTFYTPDSAHNVQAIFGANGVDLYTAGNLAMKLMSGAMKFFASNGLTELAQFSANGLDVYGSNYNTSTQEYEQVEIAHLGYGEGSGSSGTAKAPYFTFGIRVGNKGNYSVAEGLNTRASGYCAHAEGNDAQATGNLSHAECRAIASGFESHAEGDESAATGIASHAEGYFTHAYGNYAHAQNYYTKANGIAQTVIGKYNAEDTTSAFIIGNGTESNRHNALKVDWDGNLECNNIGKTLSASASKTIDTAGIDTYTEGPSVTLDAGVWVVTGQWVFNTGSTASARNLGVQLSPTSGSSASGAYKMVRVKAADNSFASLEITDIITLTATTRVYLKGASSMTYTTASGATIKAVRIK